MKRDRFTAILLAVAVVMVSGAAHASISTPALRPSAPVPSEPISSLAVPSESHVADPGEVDVFVAVMPLGMTDDGEYLDLVMVVEPETHTREWYIVQSPLGLFTKEGMYEKFADMYGVEGLGLLAWAMSRGYQVEKKCYKSYDWAVEENIIGIKAKTRIFFERSDKNAAKQLMQALQDIYEREYVLPKIAQNFGGESGEVGAGYWYYHTGRIVGFARVSEAILGGGAEGGDWSGWQRVKVGTIGAVQTGLWVVPAAKGITALGAKAGLGTLGSKVLSKQAIAILQKDILFKTQLKGLLSKYGGSLISRSANLEPYGGPGGGHHVPAQSAFAGAPGYDAGAALAVPRAELARLGVRHGIVSGAQQTLYRAFAKSGETLTWEAMQSIETQALIQGGMKAGVARATVRQAINALQRAGVHGPTRIPWGG